MILMTRNNPDGWKLDDLLREMISDIGKKSGYIKDSDHVLKEKIVNSNNAITSMLETALELHDNIYKELDAMSPNEGALKPRL